MADRTVTHIHRLDKSTKAILLVVALGIAAHAFVPFNPIENAVAEMFSGMLNGTMHLYIKTPDLLNIQMH